MPRSSANPQVDAANSTLSVTVQSPAKVNLYLHVGAKQPDGYHDVRTILHTLDLHDTLSIRYTPSPAPASAQAQGVRVTLHISDAHGRRIMADKPQDNLITKALLLYARRACVPAGHIHVQAVKRIPVQAGLGGGSSNAAAALYGASVLFPAGVALEELACELGSDVAFFLHGGCGYYTQRGDVLHHRLHATEQPLCLIKPDKGVSTAQAYAYFDSLHETATGSNACSQEKFERETVQTETVQPETARLATARPKEAEPKTAQLETAQPEELRPEELRPETMLRASSFFCTRTLLHNNLTSAALECCPALQALHEQFASWRNELPDKRAFLLCGSGSASALFCESREEAQRCAEAAAQQGYWSFAGALSCCGVQVVPL